MPVACPKCGYERQPTDSASNAECPRCGLILSKKYLSSQEQKLKAEEAAKGWFRGEPVEEPTKAVGTEPTAQLPLPSLAKSKTKNCPACNGVVAIGATACPHCGDANPPPKPTSRFVLVLAGLLLLGFVLMLATRDPAPSSSSGAGQRTPGVPYIEKGRAVTLCENYARSKANHPSTVDFSRVFDLSVIDHLNGRTSVRSTFTAKNSFNLELRYNIRCLLDHKGLIEASVSEAQR